MSRRKKRNASGGVQRSSTVDKSGMNQKKLCEFNLFHPLSSSSLYISRKTNEPKVLLLGPFFTSRLILFVGLVEKRNWKKAKLYKRILRNSLEYKAKQSKEAKQLQQQIGKEKETQLTIYKKE